MEEKEKAARPPEKTETFRAIVRGRVQGVGFRYSAIREARRLGVGGWVRNDTTGDVEVWAEGSPEKLAAFSAWLGKGPPGAVVESIHREKKTPKGYLDFKAEY
ncbi:MAG: acylphosphatase [Treponema sp.]|jgi:acylphosphatase|nr:acylphosphatase [Treponema sp.]